MIGKEGKGEDKGSRSCRLFYRGIARACFFDIFIVRRRWICASKTSMLTSGGFSASAGGSFWSQLLFSNVFCWRLRVQGYEKCEWNIKQRKIRKIGIAVCLPKFNRNCRWLKCCPEVYDELTEKQGILVLNDSCSSQPKKWCFNSIY